MAQLTPWLTQKFYAADGTTPLAGGRVWTYEAGTTTPKLSYKTQAGTVANDNPVILDANGEPTSGIWMSGGSYKFVVATATDTAEPPDSPIKTIDKVNESDESNIGVVSTIAELKALSEGEYTAVTILGYYAAGDGGGGLFRWNATRATSEANNGTIITPNTTDSTGTWDRAYSGRVDIKWFGAKGDNSTDDTNAINDCLTWANANDGDVYVSEGSYKITSTITVGTDTKLIMAEDAKFVAGSAIAIAMNGAFECGIHQCFDSNVVVTFGENSIEQAYPQWWGAVAKSAADQNEDDSLAIQNCLNSSPGKVFIPEGIYMVDGRYDPDVPNGIYGIKIPSNIEIVMTETTTLRIIDVDDISDPTKTKYSGLTANDKENIIIRGGNITGDIISLVDLNTHSGVEGSFLGLRIQGCVNVSVYDLTVSLCATDGIGIQYSDTGDLKECTNVNLINCVAHTNYRNGASVIGCEVGSIQGGSYHGNGGQSPKAGIDIEPNPNGSPTWKVHDFVVDGVAAYENGGVGIQVYAPPGTGGSPVDADCQRVQVVNCNVRDNKSQGIYVRYVKYAEVANNNVGGVGTADQQTGIYVEHSEYINVLGNAIHDHSGAGILVQNNSAVTTDNININDNNLYLNNAGINLSGVDGKTLNNINVCNNVVDTAAYGVSGAYVYGGNINNNNIHNCDNASNAGLLFSNCSDLNINGNISSYNAGNGAQFIGVTRVTLSGNKLFLNDKEGLFGNGLTNSDILSNNIFANSQGGDQSYSNISLTGSSNYNLIAYNSIRRNTYEIIVSDASAIAGTLTTSTMTTDLLNAVDDTYNAKYIVWKSGVLSGESALISDYDGQTKLLTFATQGSIPGAGDEFIIVKTLPLTAEPDYGIRFLATTERNVLIDNELSDGGAINGLQDDGLDSVEYVPVIKSAAKAGTLSTTQMSTDLTAADDTYNGDIILFTSGVLVGQTTLISDYVQVNGVLTFAEVTVAPSALDTFTIIEKTSTNQVHSYNGSNYGLNQKTPINRLDKPVGTFDVNGEINVGKNVNGDAESSGYNNLRLGILAETPTNATDVFIGPHNTGGPGGSIGDLLLIGKTSTGSPGDVRILTGNTTPSLRLLVASTTGNVSLTNGLIGTPDEITATSAGVAASVTTITTEITTDGVANTKNVTLGNGTSGQIKKFIVVAVGDAGQDLIITPATMVGGTQITFAASPLGLGCEMVYADNEGWVVSGNNGGTIS